MIKTTKHPSFFVVIFSLSCAIFFLITGNAIGQVENPAWLESVYLILSPQTDCNGDKGGTAYTDNCSTCVGGNTGKTACSLDCNNDWGGSAYLDNCSTCVEGNTGKTACTQDCNGDWGGIAYLDNCSICVGGNTGLTACSSIAILTADPIGLDFGNVTTATQLEVTIENTGSLATTPGTVVLSNNTEFTIITNNVSNTEILPAGTATITIEFDGTEGVFAETLTIPYDESVGVPATPLVVAVEADVAATNVITFTTTAQTVDVDVVAAGATVTWDYADGTSYVGAIPPVKDFGSPGISEGNTVNIDPPTALTRINFGSAAANVSHISGLTDFANLNYIYVFQNTDLVDMVVTGLAELRQMHLNSTGLTPAVFDQIILDMDAAIPGPVTGANMYGNLTRTSASDAARQSLIDKGFVWNGN